MDEIKKWINWVILEAREAGNPGEKPVLERIGHRCYQDSEMKGIAERLSKEFRQWPPEQGVVSFLEERFTAFSFTQTDSGFIVNLNNTSCYCPIVREGYTTNPNMCECTRSFDQTMYETILFGADEQPGKIAVEVLDSLLLNNKSCRFKITFLSKPFKR